MHKKKIFGIVKLADGFMVAAIIKRDGEFKFGDSLYHDNFGKPVYYSSFEEAAAAVDKYEEEIK